MKDDILYLSWPCFVEKGSRTELSALHAHVSRRPHEVSDKVVYWGVLNIFKDDVSKVFLSLIFRCVRRDFELRPEDVLLSFVKSDYGWGLHPGGIQSIERR